MRIEAIECFHVAHPLIEPWTTAYGSDADVHAVVVRMRSGGADGWAESAPLELPTYSPEYGAGVFQTVVTVMAPLIVGAEISSAAELVGILDRFKGNNFAKASLEMAWWQLLSAIEERPLAELLGGSPDRLVPVGEAIGIGDSLDSLLERIGRAFADGYERVKLKVRPEADLERLREVRAAFPDGAFHIDCNCGYTLDDMAMFEQLDELELTMIEQPLAYGDLVDHATLQARMRTAICLDESCISVDSVRAAIEVGACRIINIKPPRVGGLSNALAIVDVATKGGVRCWVGSMLESSIGTSCNLAMASVAGIDLPCDIFPDSRFYDTPIAEAALELAAPGRMRPLALPSSALRPRLDVLAARTIQQASLP